MNRLIDYQKDLLETLKDQHVAFQYLNAAVQDEDPRMFILALSNVLEAQLDKELLQNFYPIEYDSTFACIKAAISVLGLKFAIQTHDRG